MCIVLYIYRSAIRCAKFGVAVFKASMLNWRGVNLPYVDVHCSIYIYIYIERERERQRERERERSAIICTKFGVAVFKAYMLDCRGQSAMGKYALCYV